MRLISATVRNYRIHREQTVAFDPQRTLIGGPNETGKSTLVEAIHRTLFLRAKGNTEFHRAMQSLDGGNPEVELAFEVAGRRYTVRKRFGANGTVNLLPDAEQPLNGEEAEQKLAELLSVEAVAGKAVLNQWSHLWVWQGRACEDPSAHASSIKADLLRRLQHEGASALLQSERDSRVAEKIAASYAEIFTSLGKVKAGCELDICERAVAEARQRLDSSKVRVAILESAAGEFEAARAELPGIEQALQALEREQVILEERSARIAELQRRHLEESYVARQAGARYDTAKTADERIAKLQVDVQREEAFLAPWRKELSTLAEASDGLRRAAVEAQRTYDGKAERSRAARAARDLSTAVYRLLVLQREKRLLEERQRLANELRKQINELEQERGRLPALNLSALRKLQKLEVESDMARHLVESVATGIELLSSESPVLLGGESLFAGRKKIITEEVELTRDGLRLRITPGGGTTLAEARKELAESQKALRDSLAKYGIESVTKAAEILAGRDVLNSKIEKAQAQVEGMGADQIASQLSAAAEEIAALSATIERLREQLQSPPECADEPEARSAVTANEVEVANAEAAESSAKAARDIASVNAEEAATALSERQKEFDRQNQRLEVKRAELRVLIQSHGEETSRHDEIVAAEREWKVAQARADAVQREIETLQPALVESDRKRLRRSIDGARERRSTLGNTIAAAEAALRSEGLEDPQATLALAEVQLRSAESRRDEVRRRADAISLLHRSFQEEQRALSEQFTRPLADKISGYLQCLFGAGARAALELDENGFSGLAIVRGGSAERFRFEALSGGTREQTAAAMRLAMAEVLAEGHGGCLPVVFDDAFVFSDPVRVQLLQRMLDHAAEAGLQVIVLTCSPGDYVSLGAHHVTLRPPIRTGAAASSSAEES